MAHILITNDDGIQAEGLRALVQAVEGLGTISVVAPSHERSASAQSLTLRQPIFWEQVAEREWAVEGTPADSVILALNKLLPNRPDLVISGINRGGQPRRKHFLFRNGGRGDGGGDQSHPGDRRVSWRTRAGDSASSMPRNSRGIWRSWRWPRACRTAFCLNVNVPLVWNGSVRSTRQSKKVTRNVLQEGTDPRGRSFYWLLEQEHIEGIDPKSDYAAIFDGAASVTPLHLDRTHDMSLDHLSQWAARLEAGAENAEPIAVARPNPK